MKDIKLTKGKVTLVDDEDYEWLNQWKWHYTGNYVGRTIRIGNIRKTIYMHRIVLNPPNDMFTDHINHNKLDNRRCNLRICTRSQNNANNRLSRSNTSGRRGVYWYKQTKKWKAQIKYKGHKLSIGYFLNIEDAAKAYRTKAKELFGEFACEENSFN
jgi:hypothetical protein